MISIENFPIYPNMKEIKECSDPCNFSYIKPINPVEKIIKSKLSTDEKINQIQNYLVERCGIIEGSFSKYLAVVCLDDKMLLGRYKKKNAKKNSTSKKKKRSASKKRRKKRK